MGERIFPHTEEVDIHGITTVYNELIELKNHNDIIDSSIENIYSNLDYDNYKKDIKLIQNAKYNICFGLGGQLCTSTIFGKSTIVYCKVNDSLNTNNFKKNNFYFNNLNDFFTLIKEKCFV
jgi:DNA-binding MurR/RpiR family transcriptional regulator